MRRQFITTLGALLAAMPCAFATPQPVRWTSSNLAAQTQAPRLSKKDVLSKLKVLQDRQILEATELETAIHKQLGETLKLDVSGDDPGVASRRTALVTKKIEELNKRRNELNARREIVDRVTFQIDSKWDGHSKLQDFLVQTFIDMASTDLSDGRDNRLWKEFTYLSMVMREIPEPNDDVISLFEGYLNFASVLDPKTPADFIASRNYTNGLESEAAHVAGRDTRAEQVAPPAANSKLPPTLVLKSPLPSAEELSLDAAKKARPVSPAPSGSTPVATTVGSPAPVPAAPVQVSAMKPPETAPRAQVHAGEAPMPLLPAGDPKADTKPPIVTATPTPAANATTSATTRSADDTH